ncbi:MAG: histidine kinase, partial [Saprospiraceae bacterium]
MAVEYSKLRWAGHLCYALIFQICLSFPVECFSLPADTLQQGVASIFLKPEIQKLKVDSFSEVWIVPKNSATISQALHALVNNEFVHQSKATYPGLTESDKYEFWVAIHINYPDSNLYPLAISGYGLGGDSIWTFNDQFNIIQAERVSNTNKVIDRTGFVKTADLNGMGLQISNKEKIILIRIQNYRFGSWDLPEFFDARIYESLYYQKNLILIILFWSVSGIYIALLIFYLIQYVQVPQSYLLWNILYIICIYLPSLDGANWIFASYMEISYLWFDWKVFNVIAKLLVYIFLINAILNKKSKWFDLSKYWLIGLGLTALAVDTFFLITVRQSESLLFYFALQKISIGITIFLWVTLAFQRDYVAKIINRGALIVVLCELISWRLPNPLDELIVDLGTIAQLFLFAVAMNHRIKLKDKAALELEQNHKLLKLENANIQHTLRQEVAHDIHDEVGSTLTKLSLAAQWAKVNPQDHSEHVRFYDQMVQDLSQVSQQVRDLVFSIGPGNDSFGDLQSQVRNLCNEYLMRTSISVVFEMKEDFNDGNIAGLVKRNLLAITRETLHNIVKHSKASLVNVKLQMTSPDYYELMIEDNGQGFVTDQKKGKGNGLRSLQLRAERI